ncbi:uncharacterized protein LOC114387436 isoform X1 [Glycine soja]|uniref:uncharacterized protein LOC114387436 isoform X1 n=1 Tax=Glycine soja TaxID=3848 RepID=UPI00103DA68D|nr:uncharacterized protein LOC114387436 isoform X1 [Glycine soja]
MQLWCLCNGLDREHAGHQSVGGEQQLVPCLTWLQMATFNVASRSWCCCVSVTWFCTSFHLFCCQLIQDETDVSVVSLDEQLEDWTDKEISDFSSLIGGSYAPDALEPLNGVLTIPLTNDASVNLHMSKKAERKFIVGLMSLTHNVQRAIQMHDNLSQSAKGPTELLTGCFNGFKGCKSRGIKLCGPLAAAGMIAAWTSKCLPNYQREKYVAWTSSHSEQCECFWSFNRIYAAFF